MRFKRVHGIPWAPAIYEQIERVKLQRAANRNDESETQIAPKGFGTDSNTACPTQKSRQEEVIAKAAF
jgi:hypothetical protein